MGKRAERKACVRYDCTSNMTYLYERNGENYCRAHLNEVIEMDAIIDESLRNPPKK